MSNKEYIDTDGKQYTEEEVIAVIPKKTFYCYEYTGESIMCDTVIGHNGEEIKVAPYSWPKIKYCPFWDYKEERANKRTVEQDCGYCHFLKRGDWESEGISLLWDACKECGINEPTDEDLDEEFSSI